MHTKLNLFLVCVILLILSEPKLNMLQWELLTTKQYKWKKGKNHKHNDKTINKIFRMIKTQQTRYIGTNLIH